MKDIAFDKILFTFVGCAAREESESSYTRSGCFISLSKGTPAPAQSLSFSSSPLVREFSSLLTKCSQSHLLQ
jgi:hypothetical protein